MSSSHKDTGHIEGLGPTLMTSLYLNHLFKDPISKDSHIVRYWGLECQAQEFGEGHNSAHDIVYVCSQCRKRISISFIGLGKILLF